MSVVGQPIQNGLVERFIRTLKEEHVDFSDYYGYDESLSKIVYMTHCIQSALDYLTPTEFETLVLSA